MVFQDYALFPHMRVRENVAYGLRLAHVAKREITRRVRETLDFVGLTGLGERYPGELSGGQQQRVALARALIVEPEVLLLDEPPRNLDAKLREQIRWELRAVQQRLGITFIYVTHDQEEALAASDWIAVMNRGRVEQWGTPREIYERPRTAFLADFVGTVNLLPATVVGREGNDLVVSFAGPSPDRHRTGKTVGRPSDPLHPPGKPDDQHDAHRSTGPAPRRDGRAVGLPRTTGAVLGARRRCTN